MTGELLAGRYQLEQELGRGGMATVFLATDLRLARRVAVKVMHPGGDGQRAERFRREAELVASLKHPNVLEIHDFGEDAERGPFLVCEWVQGESLRELAQRLSPVPSEVAAVLAWELARALGEAHGRGVVHRDVKPENVLVARGGPLKLADFGIAALEDQERLTSTGAVTGSLAYMAPERIDTGAFSPASDVYAVGVILFELCAGTTPHEGKGSAHLAVSVMTKDAPELAERVPGTPEPLSALVARCLARDARDRPPNGEELAALLEDVVSRIAGPPSEESRAFFLDPSGYSARRREARFQHLLSEGRAWLAKGQGAQAAKVLNGALVLRPEAPEVMALLRQRPRSGRSKAWGVGAVLVGVGALAWGAYPWRPSPPPEQVPAVPVSVPTPALPEEAQAAVVPKALPPPKPQAVSSPPSSKGKVPPRRGPVEARSEPATPARPAVSDSPQDPLPAPVSTEPGTLKVATRPWAEVFVDGTSRGYTPRVRELSLSPGSHRLRYVNPLCDTVEEVLQVSPGETVTREVTLQVTKAELSIVAPEGALVAVDGVEVGEAPLTVAVNVTQGVHVISARVPGRSLLQREVNVVAGKRIQVVLKETR
ncbi:protein kinase [Stigmatella sp. ncwal1]|uniref:Protein kinase n=1 Tax=Stigmatella ashevillensis TaxID=2995309 RepID=A0ABT5D365_9BACT|nr:serine/threonine-protein kinase [Stigmatella ashevillena]MDC0708119.1 protein kinase [Stigmatella ashevillena]